MPKGATSISNGSELFGSAMVLPNGQKASDGFAALSAFAQQGATVIDASNPIFNELEVWVDTGYSGEGSSGAPVGTLFTLSQLNIESLNLKPTVVNESSNGNTIGLKSSFTTTDGKTHEMADVWLASTDATSTAVNQLTQALIHYTSGGTSGVLSAESLNQSVTLPITALQSVGQPPTSNLSVLSQILSQYDQNGQSIAGGLPTLQAANSRPGGVANSSASIGSLVSSNNQLLNSSYLAPATASKSNSSS